MTNLNNLFPTGVWRMLGTEKTGLYSVRAASVRGRVGVRHLPGGTVRVRLELPTEGPGQSILSKMQKELSRDIGYKQPGDSGENRFSIVVEANKVDEVVDKIMVLMGRDKLKSFVYNPDEHNQETTDSELVA